MEKVNPDLVVRDKDGKPYTVRYDAVNAMLLNEFLKEHRKTDGELEATVAPATLKGWNPPPNSKSRPRRMEKVSAQLAVSESVPWRT